MLIDNTRDASENSRRRCSCADRGANVGFVYRQEVGVRRIVWSVLPRRAQQGPRQGAQELHCHLRLLGSRPARVFAALAVSLLLEPCSLHAPRLRAPGVWLRCLVPGLESNCVV